MLEWFDFGIFAFMTPIISSVFFPVDPKIPAAKSMRSWRHGDLWRRFLMRPIGALYLVCTGSEGRKAALTLVMALMSVSIALITFAPTYRTVGVLAPLVVLASRLLQAFGGANLALDGALSGGRARRQQRDLRLVANDRTGGR